MKDDNAEYDAIEAAELADMDCDERVREAVEEMTMKLQGAEERAQIILAAKDYWRDRALKAESAVAAEREACAKVAEERPLQTAHEIAAKIRARGGE